MIMHKQYGRCPGFLIYKPLTFRCFFDEKPFDYEKLKRNNKKRVMAIEE
jgi:hypothetical protein